MPNERLGPVAQSLVDVYPVLAAAGMAVGAYHGYKRDRSVGWAIGWGFLGGMFPYFVIPIALAQGIGTPHPALGR